MSEDKRDRIAAIVLDEDTLAPANPNIEHERRVAMFDIIEGNSFAVVGADCGPYTLRLSSRDGRLDFDVAGAGGEEARRYALSLAPLRGVIKDYFLVCESYYAAIREASPSQIEAIDMGRRGLHNEAAEEVAQALTGVFEFDFETARRFFTLICALAARTSP